MTGGNARPKAGCWFDVQKQPMHNSSGGPLAKKPHLEARFEGYQDSRQSSGCCIFMFVMICSNEDFS